MIEASSESLSLALLGHRQTESGYNKKNKEVVKYEDIILAELNSLTKPDFIGHGLGVRSVVVHADNQFIASGSNDSTIKIWSIKERKELCTLEGHTNLVSSVAVSADCKFIVSGSIDTTVKIWSIQDQREECTLKGHRGQVLSVAVSADCRLIVSGSDDCSLKLWSIQERRQEYTFVGHTLPVTSVAMSLDCKFVVSGSLDNKVKLWSIQDLNDVFTFTGHTSIVSSVTVSADNRFIVSGSGDKTIKVWNIAEQNEEWTFIGHTNTVSSVAVSPNCRFIVSGSSDNTIKIWSLQKKSEECTFLGHTSEVFSVAVSTDCRFIVSGSSDKLIKLWRIQHWREDYKFTGHTDEVSSVTVSPDERFIMSGSEDNTIKVWNLQDRDEEFSLTGHAGKVNSLAVSADGSFVVSGSSDKTIKIWDITERREVHTIATHKNEVCSVAMSVDNRFIISGSEDKKIKLWNIQEQKVECTFRGHKGSVLSVAVSADGRFIMTGSQDHTIKIWSIQDRKEESTLIGHKNSVLSVAVSADSRFIVSGSGDSTIKIWSIQERREEYTFIGHTSKVNSVTVSADCKFIVSGSEDKTIKIWNVQERRDEGTISVHTEGISSVAVGASGLFIVSGSSDKTISITNAQVQREESISRDRLDFNRSILTKDGKFILLKEGDCKVKILNAKTQKNENFSLKRHENLLKYIPKLFDLVNCSVVVTKDVLLVRSEFRVVCTAQIHNQDLQFSFDLSIICSGIILEHSRFINCVRSSSIDLTHMNPDIVTQYYGILRYTLSHYFCYSGDILKIKIIIECCNYAITADVFGKSPLYYAIVKKRQDCVDLLLEKIESMRYNYPRNYDDSVWGIRNDIPLLIKNSSRNLHQLLSGLLCSSSLIYSKVSEDLPILQLCLTQSCSIHDFPNGGIEDIPILLQYSKFPLIGENGCTHNAILLASIIHCKEATSLRSPIINYIVELQFNAVRYWVLVYTILLCLNIILLIALVGFRTFNAYLVIFFITVNTLLFFWEVIQLLTNFQGYLQDYWNYMDLLRNVLSMAWIGLGLSGYDSLHLTWCVALLSLLRGITVFRLFDGTRFYIELIFRSLNEIKYFFLMFAYSTFTFGCLLMISNDEIISFNSMWKESFDLNFGSYEDTSNGNFMPYIGYFGATIINVILMLNLLISILGDSYERFQLEQTIVDIKEKARISMELQSMMFWAKKKSPLKYIRLCNYVFQSEEDQDWEGRMRFMDNKIDKGIKDLIKSDKSIETLLEGKFSSVENKISDIQAPLVERVSDIRISLEGKIASVEGKIDYISTSVEGKIASLEDKMNGLSQKLEVILNIISK